MRKNHSIILITGVLFFGFVSQASAKMHGFTTIDAPGAPSTVLQDINSAGQIVGNAGEGTPDYAGYGFFFDGTTFTNVPYPDAYVSGAYGINDRNEIVGSYNPLGLGSQGYYYAYRGFLLSGGNYISIEHPYQCQTHVEGINDNGKIVGRYLTGGREKGFLFDGTNFMPIDLPGDPNHIPLDINNNDQIVGMYNDGYRPHGYILNLNDGAFKNIDYPASDSSYVTGINDFGEIVGVYKANGRGYGYFSSDGINFITIDYPGSIQTVAYGINNNGQLVGTYTDTDGHIHGYMVTSERNQAQAAISHQYIYDTEEDFLWDSPVLMKEIWKWFVGNLIDTGEEMTNVKFTANCPFSVIWAGQQPSSQSPPVYVWDYGVDVPEDTLYNVGGDVEPGVALSSRVRATREVIPEILDAPEVIQTINVEVIFTSLPPQRASVYIGVPRSVLYNGLITSEVLSQNDLPKWNEQLAYARAVWTIEATDIELGVPYHFAAQIKSTKSPRVMGDPIWKPSVQIDMRNDITVPQPPVGKSYTLTHPDGVTVTFETANDIGWIPAIDAGGIEVGMTSVYTEVSIAPLLDPIGNKTVGEGELLLFTISATDPNEDPLTYSASNLPPGATFNPVTQTFSWRPSYTQADIYSNVHFEVSDGDLTDSEDITIEVLNVNRPPIEVELIIKPEVINQSRGVITGFVFLHGAYKNRIITSAVCDGVSPFKINYESKPDATKAILKFRNEFENLDTHFELDGELDDGTRIHGTDDVMRVILKGK